MPSMLLFLGRVNSCSRTTSRVGPPQREGLCVPPIGRGGMTNRRHLLLPALVVRLIELGQGSTNAPLYSPAPRRAGSPSRGGPVRRATGRPTSVPSSHSSSRLSSTKAPIGFNSNACARSFHVHEKTRDPTISRCLLLASNAGNTK